jgi:hypothetical protein
MNFNGCHVGNGTRPPLYSGIHILYSRSVDHASTDQLLWAAAIVAAQLLYNRTLVLRNRQRRLPCPSSPELVYASKDAKQIGLEIKFQEGEP